MPAHIAPMFTIQYKEQTMVKLIISGACGAMGQALTEMAVKASDIELIAGVDPRAGGIPAYPAPLVAEIGAAPAGAQVVCDFSHLAALPSLLAYARDNGCALVLAATGYGENEQRMIRQAAGRIAIFQTANMSLGMNLLCELAAKAAGTLGDAFDVEIMEKHHHRKIDAPSGSAYMLARAVNGSFPVPKEIVLDRPARRQPRGTQEIGIVALRGGTVPGEHEVGFYGEDEVILLTHTALSRRVFAAGALRAATYIAGKKPGLYDMQQLLLEESLVTHLGVDRDVALLSLRGIPFSPQHFAAIFQAVSQINIDMISQTAPVNGLMDVSFSLPERAIDRAVQALSTIAHPAQIVRHLVKLTVEGPGMAHAAGVASRVFDLLSGISVAAHIITTSETKISLLIDASDEARAVQAIRQAFGI